MLCLHVPEEEETNEEREGEIDNIGRTRKMGVRKGGLDRPGPNDRFGNLVFYCDGQKELKTQVSIETCEIFFTSRAAAWSRDG